MICPYCSSNIKDDSKFCPQCGAFVENNYSTGAKLNGAYSNSGTNNFGEEPVYSSQGPEPYQFSYDQPRQEYADGSYSGMAIAGFVLSFIFPLLGLIFSAVGLSQCKKGRRGKGLAIAGLVLSIIWLALQVAAICTGALSGVFDNYYY